MEQYELELIADELEKILIEKDIDRTRAYIYQKFIDSVRSGSDSDLDDFLENFGG